MAEKELNGIRISRLEPIPKSWTKQQVQQLLDDGIVPVVDTKNSTVPKTYKLDIKTFLKNSKGSTGVSAFIGSGTASYNVTTPTDIDTDTGDTYTPDYVFDISSMESVGSDYEINENRLVCKEGWVSR